MCSRKEHHYPAAAIPKQPEKYKRPFKTGGKNSPCKISKNIDKNKFQALFRLL